LFGRGLVAASFGLSAALYPRLPDMSPTHFDLAGRADHFVAKPLGPFIVPLIGLAAYAIASAVVTRQRPANPLHVIPTAFAALFLAMNAIILRTEIDDTADTTRLIIVACSLFVAVFGNYLGKLRRNRWLGIRTPWTLADDEVWSRTHRLAAPLFVAGGALALVGALAGAPAALCVGVLAAGALVSAASSYVIFRHVSTHRETGGRR
jgi:uncharacterized membrane protein